jgi:cathepsin L
LKYGQLVSLSEEHVIDCTSAYGNNACNGGWLTNGYDFARDDTTFGATASVRQFGLDSETNYAYSAFTTLKNGICKYPSFTRVATGQGYVNVAPNEAALQAAVANVGPVSVAIYASDPSFSFYASGTIFESFSIITIHRRLHGSVQWSGQSRRSGGRLRH